MATYSPPFGEVREETGLEVDEVKQAAFSATLGGRDRRLYLVRGFEATVFPGNDVVVSGEHDRHMWISPAEALRRAALLGGVLRLAPDSTGPFLCTLLAHTSLGVRCG